MSTRPKTHATSASVRSHHCGRLHNDHVGQDVVIAGWIQRKRDHGGLCFADLRDASGVAQVVSRRGSAAHMVLDATTVESVVRVEGRVVARHPDNVNAELPTGDLEVVAERVEVLGAADELPLAPAAKQLPAEEIRLRHRHLDLRRPALRENVLLRSRVIASLRRRMEALGFVEIQTPILTASSPEGARDYLVPARRYPGKFYALPQAPQQYKQLLMCAGFERYYQIAPCFRDEDARADRSPG